MVTVKNLKKSYGENTVFDGFDMQLPDVGTFYISGRSGCGKTTLLRIISGLDKDYEGIVSHDGTISYVFQENRLIPSATAYENVYAVCQNKEKSLDLLSVLGLGDDTGKYPGQLSGGMNRRVAIARALAFEHDILLLDEPFTALDEEIKGTVISLIKEYEKSRLVIFVSHDEDEAEALGCTQISL